MDWRDLERGAAACGNRGSARPPAGVDPGVDHVLQSRAEHLVRPASRARLAACPRPSACWRRVTVLRYTALVGAVAHAIARSSRAPGEVPAASTPQRPRRSGGVVAVRSVAWPHARPRRLKPATSRSRNDSRTSRHAGAATRAAVRPARRACRAAARSRRPTDRESARGVDAQRQGPGCSRRPRSKRPWATRTPCARPNGGVAVAGSRGSLDQLEHAQNSEPRAGPTRGVVTRVG
jgi:hypothetical protein